jgi:hypothetical protein
MRPAPTLRTPWTRFQTRSKEQIAEKDDQTVNNKDFDNQRDDKAEPSLIAIGTRGFNMYMFVFDRGCFPHTNAASTRTTACFGVRKTSTIKQTHIHVKPARSNRNQAWFSLVIPLIVKIFVVYCLVVLLSNLFFRPSLEPCPWGPQCWGRAHWRWKRRSCCSATPTDVKSCWSNLMPAEQLPRIYNAESAGAYVRFVCCSRIKLRKA